MALVSNPFSRMTFIADDEGRNRVALFANGEQYECSLELAQALCSSSEINPSEVTGESDGKLLTALYQQGAIVEAD